MHSMPLQSPPKGMHRYVFLLYKQHGRVNASNPKSRANWTLHQFAQVFSILERHKQFFRMHVCHKLFRTLACLWGSWQHASARGPWV